MGSGFINIYPDRTVPAQSYPERMVEGNVVTVIPMAVLTRGNKRVLQRLAASVLANLPVRKRVVNIYQTGTERA